MSPLERRQRVDDLICSLDGYDPILVQNLDGDDLAYAAARAADPGDPGQAQALAILARVDPATAVQAVQQALVEGAEVGLVPGAITAIAPSGPLALPVAATAASSADPGVALAAWATLQQVADGSQMGVMELLSQQAPALVAEQAAFAQSVVAYREGLLGFELPVPDASALLDMDPDADGAVIQSGPAGGEDFDRLMHLSSAELYMLTLSVETTLAIDCAGEHMLLAMDVQVLGGAPTRFLDAPALAGLIAQLDPLADCYSVHGLAFTWPDGLGGFHVAVHEPNGEQAYFGTGGGQEVAEVSLRSVLRPGAVPIDVSLVAAPEGVQLTQAFSSLEIAASAPTADLEPDTEE
jgi:hypothetical protein